MKKTVILLVIACLGLGSGIYVANKTQDKNFAQTFVDKEKQLASGPWSVKHPHWTGKLIKTADNRVKLDRNGDMATIISNQNGLLTVKWDRWGKETFKCDNKNNCTLNK